MRIQAMHPGFRMPTMGSTFSGAHDIYMPTAGRAWGDSNLHGLGFATEIPEGHVALLLPRSSTGAKFGLELNNTVGVIDADYRGEWKAAIRTKNGAPFEWQMHERLFQFLIVPIVQPDLELVESVEKTARQGGFGSTGK